MVCKGGNYCLYFGWMVVICLGTVPWMGIHFQLFWATGEKQNCLLKGLIIIAHMIKYSWYKNKQDHCRGMYLPPSTAGEEMLNWKFSPLHRTLLYHSVGSKIRSKLLYLLRFSRYWHFLIFRENQRWPPKVAKIENFPLCTGDFCTTLWAESGENWNLSPLDWTLLYHPVSQKFARNHSISYSLRYWHFSIFCKNPRWPPKVVKIEIFPHLTGHSCTTLYVKNSLEITLSVTVFQISTLFHFPQKIQDGYRKLKFSPFAQETLVPPCGSKIR